MGVSGAIPLLLRRLALVPVLVFAVLAFTYAITQIAPGDPVRIIAGQREIQEEQADRIREEYGLNGNYFERFGNYFVGAGHACGPGAFVLLPLAHALGARVAR